MSAQPVNPSIAPDCVSIEIDGQPIQAPKGSMIIQNADKAGIPIPRFCYHEKLPIAANCRMCMVECSMPSPSGEHKPIPKPLPACATPVTEGMKVFTRSQRALSGQRNVMEFLLINHPLDCPICDQGGECELQDLAMGYGRSVSRFVERKRVVPDENLGPLISTDMTRCIQCTRCVRFVNEIAGTYELGGLGRGENLEIGTYIGKTVESELSGNIIDVCPVGALTNKVFRFRARPWELIARESIGYHDALGSNLWLHTRRGEILRTVPRDNEAINECWLSDRDRYSHQGLYAADRAKKPLVKIDQEWKEVSWEEALAVAAGLLKKHAGDDLGILLHPATSCEEGYLLKNLAQGLNTKHIDYRLRQLDFADNAAGFGFEMPVAIIEKADVIVLIGTHLLHELPLVHHRVRKAVKAGAKLSVINPIDFNFNVTLTSKTIVAPDVMVDVLLALAKAANDDGHLPESSALAREIASCTADKSSQALYQQLKNSTNGVIIFGEMASTHPQASVLRAATRFLAKATGCAYNEIPQGANAIGLACVGLASEEEAHAKAMVEHPRKAYLLYGAEVPFDFADGAAVLQALHSTETVIAFSAFASDHLKAVADVILPIGLLPEIDATLVNVDGIKQMLVSGAKLPGEAKPGWKALRALGSSLHLQGFEFTDITQVRSGLEDRLDQSTASVNGKLAFKNRVKGLIRIATTPVYRADAVLRRSSALQEHPLTRGARLTLHPEDATKLKLEQGDIATIDTAAGEATLSAEVTNVVPPGTVWIETAYNETCALPGYGAELNIRKI